LIITSVAVVVIHHIQGEGKIVNYRTVLCSWTRSLLLATLNHQNSPFFRRRGHSKCEGKEVAENSF